MSSVRPSHNTQHVCELCNTFEPIPETSGSSARLPYPYPESTNPTEHNLEIFYRRVDGIHTETLVAATLFCPAPLMTRTDDTQTPKPRLCGVVGTCCLLAVCCEVLRLAGSLCLRGAFSGRVPCVDPGKENAFHVCKKVNFTANKQIGMLN